MTNGVRHHIRVQVDKAAFPFLPALLCNCCTELGNDEYLDNIQVDGRTYLRDIVSRPKARVYMRQTSHKAEISISNPLTIRPARDVGDNAVWRLGRRRLTEVRLRGEGNHIDMNPVRTTSNEPEKMRMAVDGYVYKYLK